MSKDLSTHEVNATWILFPQIIQGCNTILDKYLANREHPSARHNRDCSTLILAMQHESSRKSPEARTHDFSPIWSIWRRTIGLSSQALAERQRILMMTAQLFAKYSVQM